MADVLQGLADRLLELEELPVDNPPGTLSVPENDRFLPVTESDTDEFILKEKNKNTTMKTRSDTNLFVSWLESQKEYRKLQEIPPSELDSYLGKFYLSVRRLDGSDYEPDTLSSFQNSIERHLTDKHYGWKIKTSDEFCHSRDVLATKGKALKKDIRGNKPNKAEPMGDQDIDKLYEKDILGQGE